MRNAEENMPWYTTDGLKHFVFAPVKSSVIKSRHLRDQPHMAISKSQPLYLIHYQYRQQKIYSVINRAYSVFHRKVKRLVFLCFILL